MERLHAFALEAIYRRRRPAPRAGRLCAFADIRRLDHRQLSFCGGSAYLDVLNRNAFGNVRTLLKEVTLNATMGDYLSMRESAKADPVLQTQPDENYAREVMQLFSVGLVMLNLDGSVVLDGGGKPIPTFNEDTVKGFAKALSGWTFSGLDQSNPSRWLDPALGDADPVIKFQKTCPAESSPMEPGVAGYRSADRQRVIVGPAHDTTAKQLLVYGGAPYSTLPAGQSAQTDLDNVIDNLFNHPNVGPFLAKQLIQRLVTSNPSPQYTPASRPNSTTTAAAFAATCRRSFARSSWTARRGLWPSRPRRPSAS